MFNNLGAPPKPAAALLPVSAAGLGLPRPFAATRRVRAAPRFSAASSPAWRENHFKNSNVLFEMVFDRIINYLLFTLFSL
jgi:hypothetical protein